MMKYTHIFDTSTDYNSFLTNNVWNQYDYEIPDISLGEFYEENFPVLSYIEDEDRIKYDSKYVTVTLNDSLWTGGDGNTKYKMYGNSLLTGFNQVYNRTLTVPTPYVVTVTMDDVDVTDKYYKLTYNVQHGPDGEKDKRMHQHSVSIPRVTGDIVITTDHDNSGGGSLTPFDSPTGGGTNPIIP